MVSLKLRSRIWLVDEKDKIVMGEGRSRIFEIIEQTGSINKTAKLMRMSYKGVWSKIRASEEHFQTKLVNTHRQKGTRLTPEGKRLLERYKLLKQKCMEREEEIFRQLFGPEMRE
ncbi:MAG TPA: LysR family transcriptional regulator [Desulfobacterales bacterium]|nr:LysR family transcriptional regulator [Desulfobacterales bacterium]